MEEIWNFLVMTFLLKLISTEFSLQKPTQKLHRIKNYWSIFWRLNKIPFENKSDSLKSSKNKNLNNKNKSIPANRERKYFHCNLPQKYWLDYSNFFRDQIAKNIVNFQEKHSIEWSECQTSNKKISKYLNFFNNWALLCVVWYLSKNIPIVLQWIIRKTCCKQMWNLWWSMLFAFKFLIQ